MRERRREGEHQREQREGEARGRDRERAQKTGYSVGKVGNRFNFTVSNEGGIVSNRCY